MLKSYAGGETAPVGCYWNASTGEWINLREEGGALPPGTRGKYLKVSPGLMLLFGPVLGLLYWLFLPVVILGVVAQFIAGKVSSRIRVAWRAIVHVEAR